MRRFILAILFCLSIVLPVRAQEPVHHLYLPLVEATDMPIACTRPWRLIRPEASTNYVRNPSAEEAGNNGAVGGGIIARTTAAAHYGLRSYRVTTAANGDGLTLTTTTLAATAHYVTFRIYGILPPDWRVGIGAASKAAHRIEVIDPEWTLYGVPFSAAECNGAGAVTITQLGVGAGDFYVDGIQVEPLGHWTTYIDGTQEGCVWLGQTHHSASERSGQSLTGGELLDLWDEFNFFTEEMIGVGASPLSLDVRNYAILPGGELAGRKIEPRQFTLIGRFIGHGEKELHEKRQALILALSTDSYAEQQPVRLNFSGARVQKEIDAYYEGGLEAELPVTYGTLQADGEEWRSMRYWTERVSIQFLAEDPMFYEVGESAALLDTLDTVNANYLMVRDKDDGDWSDGGFTGNGDIFAFATYGDYLYVGGAFVNANGDINQNRIARLNKATGVWSALGGGLNGDVNALAVGADGLLYIGGAFTDAGGVLAADYVCTWDGAAFAALGVPVAGTAAIVEVNDILVAHNGDIYIAGDFLDWANIANADYAVYWDLSAGAYTAVAAGANGIINTVAQAPDGTIYFGGGFTNWGDADGDYITSLVNGALVSLGSGLNLNAEDIAVACDGLVYIGGDFTDAGGNAGADYICTWNGTEFAPLAQGTDQFVMTVEIAPNGEVYLRGLFQYASGLEVGYTVGVITSGFARWNGSSFLRGSDLNHQALSPTSPIYFDRQDSIVENNFDLYMGMDVAAYNTSGGVVAVNDGSYRAFPRVVFNRSGGTYARVESLRNETNGLILNLNYELLDGETLTIDLSPTEKTITSSLFGRRLDAILAPSDFGKWTLQPGNNNVTSFVNIAGGETIVGYMLWRDTYNSVD
jgi:hypothetical protein